MFPLGFEKMLGYFLLMGLTLQHSVESLPSSSSVIVAGLLSKSLPDDSPGLLKELPDDNCYCVPEEKCKKGAIAIGPRFKNTTRSEEPCPKGEEYCCLIFYPPTTQKPLPHCGTRNLVHIPGFNQPPSNLDLTEFGQYPWLVRIFDVKGKFLGSGALVNEDTVVSVAHLFDDKYKYPAKVVIGDWNDAIHVIPFKPVEIGVKRLRIHEDFNPSNLHNDIATIHLKEPVDLGQKHPQIGTVCLPPHSFEKYRCFLSTFGDPKLPVVREIELPIISGIKCEDILRTTILGPSFLLNHKSFICAGEPGKDACESHGGAPLVCELNEHFYLAGLVAWGLTDGTCNKKGKIPGVYTNIHSYVNWIRS